MKTVRAADGEARERGGERSKGVRTSATNLKQPLWYGCPSAMSCSIGYTAFVQTLHFVCVPEKVAIPASSSALSPPSSEIGIYASVPPGPKGPRRILAAASTRT